MSENMHVSCVVFYICERYRKDTDVLVVLKQTLVLHVHTKRRLFFQILLRQTELSAFWFFIILLTYLLIMKHENNNELEYTTHCVQHISSALLLLLNAFYGLLHWQSSAIMCSYQQLINFIGEMRAKSSPSDSKFFWLCRLPLSLVLKQASLCALWYSGSEASASDYPLLEWSSESWATQRDYVILSLWTCERNAVHQINPITSWKFHKFHN